MYSVASVVGVHVSNHADFVGLKHSKTRLLEGEHDVFATLKKSPAYYD